MNKIEQIERNIKTNDNKIVDEVKKVVNERNQSYSNVLKKNIVKTNPVVLVKPRNKEIKRFKVKKKIRNNINPEIFPVRGFRNASEGAVLIECKNKETAKNVQR
jgi:hypothetical protein